MLEFPQFYTQVRHFPYAVIQLSKPERKFTADMTYGMLAAGSCLLTDVVDQLHEDSKKINIVDRLSRHLDKGVPAQATSSYLQQIKKWVPSEPSFTLMTVIVVKSGGYKFESLGIVRDGSESTSAKNVYKKGYHVTEVCVLTTGNHPVSIFSKVHSSAEKGYKSANTVTFEAMERGSALFEKASFFITINGHLLRNCATVAKGKLKPMYFIRGKIMRLTFPMSKSRLQLPEKIFIWYWFMASQNIQ